MEPSKVMISFHVGSSRRSAETIKAFLNKHGVKDVWICTDMLGAAQFRDKIHEAVVNCDVFLMLMNSHWESSGECSEEYFLARRKHLTSLESGVTKSGQPRKPIFLPIAFPGLDWSKPKIEVLSSNTNFLNCDAAEILPENSVMLAQIAGSLASVGFKVAGSAIGPTAAGSSFASKSIQVSGSSDGAGTNLLERVQALLTAALADLPRIVQQQQQQLQQQLQQRRHYFRPEVSPLEIRYDKIIRERYVGIMNEINYIDGSQIVWSMDMTFDVGSMGPVVEGRQQLAGAIAFKVEGYKGSHQKYFGRLITEATVSTEILKCFFYPFTGCIMAVGTDILVQGEKILKTDEYRMVFSPDGLTLTGFGKGGPEGEYEAKSFKSPFRATAV